MYPLQDQDTNFSTFEEQRAARILNHRQSLQLRSSPRMETSRLGDLLEPLAIVILMIGAVILLLSLFVILSIVGFGVYTKLYPNETVLRPWWYRNEYNYSTVTV